MALPSTTAARRAFSYGGRTVFEWEQSLEEVIVYIRPPDGVTAGDLDVSIDVDHLRVGLRGNPPFIDETLASKVVLSESLWTLDDGELVINLQKAQIGTTWPSVLVGKGTLDPAAAQNDQKAILLERFQREHPGFDFSNADFSGIAPRANEFMGGLDYNKLNRR